MERRKTTSSKPGGKLRMRARRPAIERADGGARSTRRTTERAAAKHGIDRTPARDAPVRRGDGEEERESIFDGGSPSAAGETPRRWFGRLSQAARHRPATALLVAAGAAALIEAELLGAALVGGATALWLSRAIARQTRTGMGTAQRAARGSITRLWRAWDRMQGRHDEATAG